MRDPLYLAMDRDTHIALDKLFALLEKSSTFARHVSPASSKIVFCHSGRIVERGFDRRPTSKWRDRLQSAGLTMQNPDRPNAQRPMTRRT